MRQRAADQRCGGRPGCLPRTCLAVAYMHHAKQLPHRKGGTTGLMSPRMPRRLASSIAGKLEKPRQLLRNIPSKPMPCSTSGLTASTAMDWYTGYHNTPPGTPVPVREVPLPVFSPISSNVGNVPLCRRQQIYAVPGSSPISCTREEVPTRDPEVASWCCEHRANKTQGPRKSLCGLRTLPVALGAHVRNGECGGGCAGVGHRRHSGVDRGSGTSQGGPTADGELCTGMVYVRTGSAGQTLMP